MVPNGHLSCSQHHIVFSEVHLIYQFAIEGAVSSLLRN